LESLASDGARFSVYDSPLSEFSILGFEYGYSIVQPEILVLWEAQFGDFANGAQVIIDQFVSAGESKWARHSGLVMLLPHGYEGQGPEHSNAYLERYLSLCAEDNMQVVNITSPSQYFHVLRKQLHQDFRKPLVVMSPKSLLRLPEARSCFNELTAGYFKCVLDDPEPPAETETLVICSGHVWYDLNAARKEAGDSDKDSPAGRTRILRLEQLYPFPEETLAEAIRAAGASRFVWAQEEPENRGAWTFVSSRLAGITGSPWEYAGRKASASPAAGSHGMHLEERNTLVAKALGISGRKQ
jgi:2-oxoglutarate dehydrogenase E1 component